MRKLALIGAMLSMMGLLAGCTGIFNQIPKNTVLVKKMPSEVVPDETKFEGVISKETAKIVALNGVNKYFDEHFTMDGLVMEVIPIEENVINGWLEKVDYGSSQARPSEVAAPRVMPDPAPAQRAELASIIGGLYRVVITKETEPQEKFEVFLIAKDGEILKVSRTGTRQSASSQADKQVNVIELASKFIEQKGVYPLSELKLLEDSTRRGVVELYYTGRTDRDVKYSVMVSTIEGKVFGFSKDVMALLGFYSMAK